MGLQSSTHRRAWTVAAASVVAAILVSGVSYAYWSSTASGTATIGSTTAQPLVVSSIATPLADLYPGKTDDLGFTVKNDNAYPVRVTALTGVSVASSDSAACPVSNLTLSSAISPIPVGGYQLTPVVTVAGGGGTATGTLPGLVQMNTTAGDGCQGKTFTFTLTFSGTQQ
ncbi:MAG: hypothetical protein JJD92_06180 [Frankiaceae bacterium]|nr:hypothetical protein [Frankiaceae bacterium]